MNKQLIFSMLGLLVACMGVFSSCNGGKSDAAYATTENGFQYAHHIQNEAAKPQPGDYAYFHLDFMADDSLIQSSRENKDVPVAQILTPEQFAEAKMQPNPLLDVLPLMSIGDSVTIRQSLDSFPQRPPGFDNFDMVYYNVTLVNIQSEEEYNAIAEEKQKKNLARLGEVTTFCNQIIADYNAGNLNDKLTETDSGLKYVIQEEGTGEVPEVGEQIGVHYYGMLTDGTMFDNSFVRGQPYAFQVGRGQVIPGWDEGLTVFKKGTKGTLFIPHQLAYGERGSPPKIPPNAELVFYVELLESPYE